MTWRKCFQTFSLILKESIILFDKKHYNQIDRIPVGSSLGSALTNIFLSYYENNWLKYCRKDLKAYWYERYVGDTSVLFNKPEHA